jgi:hypothetical protein
VVCATLLPPTPKTFVSFPDLSFRFQVVPPFRSARVAFTLPPRALGPLVLHRPRVARNPRFYIVASLIATPVPRLRDREG